MTTFEKIEQLSDNEILFVCKGFSSFLLEKINPQPEEVFKDIPPDLKGIYEFNTLISKEIDDLEVDVLPEEAVPVAKAQLSYWSKDPDFSLLLEEYLETNTIKPMAAATILLVGAVLLTTIISTSLKIERKDGKTTISYDGKNISDNAVKLVTAVLTAIPESLKSILT
jgi:hypothetical protein